MRGVVQRVKRAKVSVDNKAIGQIDHGIMLLLGVEEDDEEKDLEYLDVNGSMLVVSQFTLLGDARKGRRPSFIQAARPEKAVPMYEKFIHNMIKSGLKTQTGEFGADMQVELVNDGPVTILLDSKKTF